MNENLRTNTELAAIWRHYSADREFMLRFTLSLVFLSVILLGVGRFLGWNEYRPAGSMLYDPFLSLFSPVDVSWITFGILYSSIIVFLIHMAFYPENFVIAMQAYAMTMLFRMTTMYLVPLYPPEAIIPLQDPFVEFFGGGGRLTRDLFFSGHTATFVIFYLASGCKSLKMIFLVLIFAIAAAVLAQHVHYTVDVLAAPFFAYGSFTIVRRLNNKVKINSHGNYFP